MKHYIYFHGGNGSYRVSRWKKKDIFNLEVETGEKFYVVYFYSNGDEVCCTLKSTLMGDNSAIECIEEVKADYRPKPDYNKDEQPDKVLSAVVYECHVELGIIRPHIDSVEIKRVNTVYKFDPETKKYKINNQTN